MTAWVLIIAWSANGTGYTAQEFGTERACQVAKQWATEANTRGGNFKIACINTVTGEQK